MSALCHLSWPPLPQTKKPLWSCKRCGSCDRLPKGGCRKCKAISDSLRQNPLGFKRGEQIKIDDANWICKHCGSRERSNKNGCRGCYNIRQNIRKNPDGRKKGELQKIANEDWICKRCGGKDRAIDLRNNRRYCKPCHYDRTQTVRISRRVKLDKALVNLTFLQLANELGKLTNE